jgi:farnesyl-diphosphate farnesyltransferase
MAQPDRESQRADAFCREILPAVSRTFALSIRFLPGKLGSAVRCSYLICRIADTIEDDTELAAEAKASLLDLLTASFDDADAAARLVEHASTLHAQPAYRRLIEHSDLVFAAFRDLKREPRAAKDS